MKTALASLLLLCATALADDHALEHLDALPLPLTNPDVHLDGVSRIEGRYLWVIF